MNKERQKYSGEKDLTSGRHINTEELNPRSETNEKNCREKLRQNRKKKEKSA